MTRFNNNFLNNLLKKKIIKNKKVLLSHGFNIALIHYNEHKLANIFLDSLASNSHLPYIIRPSWNKSNFRTLIDNIFSNVISQDILSSNVTTTISDRQLQFLISPSNTFLIHPPLNLMFLKGIGQILTKTTLM